VTLVRKLAKNMNQMNLTNDFWKGAAVIVIVPIVFLFIVGLFQGLTGVQQWLIPISGCVTLITISIGSWLAVNNYRLNVQTEQRLDDSSKIESEIKLLTQFSKMIEIANARYRPIVSEKVIDGLFQNKIVTENDFKDRESIQKLSQKLQQSVFIPPVGLATQKAAIGSVYTLGKEQ
jgi:hypothetical protein